MSRKRDFARDALRSRVAREHQAAVLKELGEGGPPCRHCPHVRAWHAITQDQHEALGRRCAATVFVKRQEHPCACPGYEVRP